MPLRPRNFGQRAPIIRRLLVALAFMGVALSGAAAQGRGDYYGYSPQPYYSGPAPGYYQAPSPGYYPAPQPPAYYAPAAPSYAPPTVVYGSEPVVIVQPLRPASCGRYRYWDGERCADARWDPPYVGPKW